MSEMFSNRYTAIILPGAGVIRVPIEKDSHLQGVPFVKDSHLQGGNFKGNSKLEFSKFIEVHKYKM